MWGAASLDGLAAILVHLVEEALVLLSGPVLLPQLRRQVCPIHTQTQEPVRMITASARSALAGGGVLHTGMGGL
jgi:hypothetical protein